MERCQIYLFQYASIIATKEIKYLFTMVNHFSKYGWARWIADKITQTTIKALKSWLATHDKPDIISNDNEKEFEQFFANLNIQQIFGMPYNPKSKEAAESFN